MANPFHYGYDYRKPRIDNRTFQSHNAYQSLYHMGKVEQPVYSNNNYMGEHYSSRVNRYTPVTSSPYSNNMYPSNLNSAQQAHYQPQHILPQTHQKLYQNVGINTDRYSNKSESNRSVKSRSSSVSVNSNRNDPPPARNSILSTYGTNSLPKEQINNQYKPPRKQEVNVVFNHQNQTSNVFQKQQKQFDIINLYSRPSEPLKKFPKLTKEHIIFERGIDLNN